MGPEVQQRGGDDSTVKLTTPWAGIAPSRCDGCRWQGRRQPTELVGERLVVAWGWSQPGTKWIG